jgi:8-oxo-dGTP diphosphatase
MKLVVAALIRRGDELLICQRAANKPMPLKWEFPGGKVEPGEELRVALARELEEELGIRAKIEREVSTLRYVYRKDDFAVELRFFEVNQFEGELQNLIFADMRWEVLSRLVEYDFLEADLELVRQIAAGGVL